MGTHSIRLFLFEDNIEFYLKNLLCQYWKAPLEPHCSSEQEYSSNKRVLRPVHIASGKYLLKSSRYWKSNYGNPAFHAIQPFGQMVPSEILLFLLSFSWGASLSGGNCSAVEWHGLLGFPPLHSCPTASGSTLQYYFPYSHGSTVLCISLISADSHLSSCHYYCLGQQRSFSCFQMKDLRGSNQELQRCGSSVSICH